MPNLQKSLKSLQVKVNQIIPGTLGLSDSLVNVPNRLGYSYVKLLGNTSELIQAYNTTVTPQYGIPVLVQWSGTQYVVLGRDVQRYSQWSASAYLPLHGDTHQWMGGDTTWILSEQFYPLSVSPSGSSLFIAPYTYNWLGNWIYGGNTGTNAITLPSDPSKQKIMLLYLDGPTGNPTWLPGTEAPLYTNAYQLLPYLPPFNMSLGIPLAMVGIPSGTTSWTWDNLYDVRQFFGGSSGGSSTGSSGTGSYGISEAPIDGNLYGRKNAGWSIVSGSSYGNVFGPASAVVDDLATFDGTTGKLIKDSGLAITTTVANPGVDTHIPTEKAVRTALSSLIGDANALVYKGVIDCSGNPNYPAADAGYVYIVSVAGKIGGSSGIVVSVGDMLLCNTDSTPSGNQATVGAYWNVIEVAGNYQAYSAILTTLAALSNSLGWLKNDGSGGLSYTTPTAANVGAPGLVNPSVVDNFVSFSSIGGAQQDSGHKASDFLTSVTAHNILSATHGDTLVDTVVRGDILYGNATPKWARLAFPATPTGKILQATATDVGWSANPLTIGAGASVAGSNTGDQTITLTGNVTGSGTGSFATTIAAGVVTLTMHADMATASLFYRKTAGNGPPEVNTLATLKTDLGLTGNNSGDQTITLTSDVTGSGTGSFATTIANSAVTLAKMADMATASLIYRKTAGTGAPEVNTLATLKTDLGLTGMNSGDQVVPVNEAGAAHNFLTAYNSTTGAWSKAQPSASDVSGLGTLAVVNDAASDGSTYGRKNGAWATVSAGGGDISGTGIVGQVAEFVTNTKTLQASNLIAPANLLTLSAAGAYTLTIPATGTVALLGTINVFSAKQEISLSSGSTGLSVHGTINDNSTAFGIYDSFYFTGHIGAVGLSVSATANKTVGGYTADITGIQAYASVQSTDTEGVSAIIGIQSQVSQGSANITVNNAYDFYALALTSGKITNAYGLYIGSITAGGTLNYAIYTNAGKVHFGGDVDISGSLSLSGAFPFQRNITSNLSLINGQCFIIAKYLNLGTYSLTLAGDSRLEILQ